MRIGFDSTPLLYTRSGVGTYVAQLLRHLPATHPQWEYILYSNKPLPVLDMVGLTPVPHYFPTSRWVWEQFHLPRIITQSGADLCHFMNNSAPWATRLPYVLTIHDASLFLFQQYHPRSRLLALRLLLPQAARRAEVVITVSHASRQELIDVLQLPPEKVRVVHNAVSCEFQPLRDEEKRTQLRQKHQLPAQFVLYVGTIEPRKNLLRLIAAFGQTQKMHPDCHLVLAGPKGWLMNGDVEKEIKAAELVGKVHYLGFVPPEDLPGIYSLATLFAFPSLHEGFGLPILEAMACGTPVLTSNRSAMPEVSGTAAYLVDPESITAIAEGLHLLLQSADRRAWHSAQGLARVQQFSWTKAAQETAAIYEQVAGQKR